MGRNIALPWLLGMFSGACLLGGAGSAAAYTLAQYTRDVVVSAPVVLEQLHVYRQVLQDYEIARAGWRPSLDLTATSGRFSRKAPNTGQQRKNFNSSEADLTLTQNLFDGFDTTNQLEQAKARISSALYQLYDTADNAALDAVRAYMSVLTERRLVTLAERNVESHERILAQIRDRDVSGVGRRSDVEQTAGRLARAQASLIAQQNNLQDALTQLHKLLGRYVDPAELVDPVAPELPPGALTKLIDQALAQHPGLESARRNIAAARFDYRRSRSSNLPRLDLQLQQSVGEDVGGISGNVDDRSVVLNLQYNFYRGGADQAEQRKRISAVHESEAFRTRVRRQVIDALRLAWTADRALREQIPFLEDHVKNARATLELYHEEYFLLKRDLLDLLDAESELNTALIREAQAHYDALSARYRVYEGLGDLFQPLGLAVKVEDDDLVLVNYRANGIDTLETDPDSDKDERINDTDQCDNSSEPGAVDGFGCKIQSDPEFGYHGVNTPPQATDDTLTTAMNTALSVTPAELLDNDQDADGDRLTIQGFGQPTRGSVKSDADGLLIYAPRRGFVGLDTFTYTITDSRGDSASASVSVRVGPTTATLLPNVLQVQFGYKSLELTHESQARARKLLETLLRSDDARVDVYAHTDNVGSRDYNRRLSERRAQALRQQLVGAGMPGDRVRAFGMGDSDPVADNATDQGRALNRRGEIRYSTGGATTVQEPAKGPMAAGVPPAQPRGSSNWSEPVHLQFAYKQPSLTPDSEERFDLFAEQLARFPQATIEIRAYTDNVGSETYNRGLSTRRARQIKQWLVERGIDGSRVHTLGMGEADPVADNGTEHGRALNRRAELRFRIDEPN